MPSRWRRCSPGSPGRRSWWPACSFVRQRFERGQPEAEILEAYAGAFVGQASEPLRRSTVINRFQTKLPSGRVATYEYPRYFFTNYSAEIRTIFTDHCELLGIRWTQSNSRNISISHRDSVALMDSFIGPKR